MDDIETKVLKHIDSLSIAEPSLDESFSDLRMDSLDVVELLVGIEKEFNISLPNEYLSGDKKGRDIVNYINCVKNVNKYYSDTGLKTLTISWFQDIIEQCDTLTTANISHKRPTIKGIASRSKQYVEEFEKDCEPGLRSRLVKYFTAIENMADELTTGNVAHKKAAIKGSACRAKEYLIKHT